MEKNTKGWRDEVKSVNELSLDLQNPRLPKNVREQKSLVEVLGYLLVHEGVMDIAQSIAANGYHKSAVSIAYKEGKKLIVLDGNRRLAACHLLLNPSLAKSDSRKRKLETLGKMLNKKELLRVKIVIAPSRKEAEREIWDIHVNRLLKSWEQLQRLRMYRNLIDEGEFDVATAAKKYGTTKGKFAKELARLYFYEQILEFGGDASEEKMHKAGFNAIDRLILSKNGQRLLKYNVTSEGAVIFEDLQNAEQHLKKLTPYIIGDRKIPAQSSQEELKKEVYIRIDPQEFSASVKTETHNTEKSIKRLSEGKKMPDWVTTNEYRGYNGAERVKRMLDEMSRITPTKNQNVLCPAVRILLELALYDKLSKTGHIKAIIADKKAEVDKKNSKRQAEEIPLVVQVPNWTPSFKEMLSYISDPRKNIITEPQEIKALKRVMSTSADFIEELNNFVHNVRYLPAASDPERLWGQFGRLLFSVIEKIK